MNEESPNVIEFVKASSDGESRCTIELCKDKSAYVDGDEIEMIFEFAPDNLGNAISHVEKLGYSRCDAPEGSG